MKSFQRYKGRFKGLLFVFAIIIIFLMFLYTDKIVNKLRENSREILELNSRFIAKVAEKDISGNELNFVFDQIIRKINFPIVITDLNGEPTHWKGVNIDPLDRSQKNLEKLKKIVQKMDSESEPIPLKYEGRVFNYIHYGDSKLIRSLQWLPYIEIIAIGLFILIGFIGFNNIRKSEERLLWVGMAKETAHQLGTPISSLMGWQEIIKQRKGNITEKMLTEMEKDLNRLNKVAQRFSRIGSNTGYSRQDVREILRDTVIYFKNRLPQYGKKVDIEESYSEVPLVKINRDLIEWSIENLIKNSLDALKPEGGKIKISVQPISQDKGIIIDIEDNGKGIPKSDRKKIFNPGFSTKVRGWGLGLNLAKRIVEDYHRGKLFLKKSKVGAGTTMSMVLYK